VPVIGLTQVNNSTKNSLENEMIELFSDSPFEGVKILEDEGVAYLLSVSIQTNSGHKTSSSKNRVAQVMARRNAMVFMNGSTISSEQIIKTNETITMNSVSYYEEFIDRINESSSGFIDGLEVLTTFNFNQGKEYAYILFRKLE
jgi:hypothetical protein